MMIAVLRAQLFLLAVLSAIVGCMGAANATDAPKAPEPAVQGAPALPPGASTDWWAQVQREIAAQEYRVTWQDKSALPDGAAAYQAPNRAQGLRTYFTEVGPRVVRRDVEAPEWVWGLELTGLGTADALAAPPAIEGVTAEGNRFEYHRGGVTEWYVNSDKGLEQGFTIKANPTGENELVVSLAVRGDLTPDMMPGGETVEFLSHAGVGVIHYGGLEVTDATGRLLHARMELDREGHRLLLRACVTGAQFPVTIDPLATSAAWTAESNQSVAQSGYSVATAGDVNGDGYADVIVGVPYYTNDQSYEGAAFLYLGSPSGLSATAAWSVEGNQANASLGLSVATAGDVNGDGYSDVVVGTPFYTNGQDQEGAASVYHGSTSGLSTTPAWTTEANIGYSMLGFSVATAGDVNGDGYSDVVVGAYGYANGSTGEGAAFVYYGSTSGLSTSADWTMEGNQNNADFGYSVSTAGDVNGDGYSDIIVGARLFTNGLFGEGAAFVYHGSAGGLSTSAAWTAEANQIFAQWGSSVATAGDVNGDGYSDVIVGAPYYDNGTTDEGMASVYHGSASGLSTSAAWTAEGNMVDVAFGRSVATAGDVNGDGYSEVIVGAPNYGNGYIYEGIAFLYTGSASGLSTTAAWSAEGDNEYAYYGCSVATAGDVNGDGISDVIVGAYGYSNGQMSEGRAFVYYGATSSLATSATWTMEGNQDNAFAGFSVSTAGDVNGDGFGDVIVGAYEYDNGNTDEGAAFVYHGSASGLSTTPAWTSEGNQDGAYFGCAVATAGDVNGDGYSDVIVGARQYDDGETNEGAAFVYHGSPTGLATFANWTGESNQATAWFGSAVSTAGDVNGDGYADVIVGAPNFDNTETNEGAAFVYHGSPTGLSTSADRTVEINQASAALGRSVSTAGDVNGDGYSDVIVGASGYDNGETNEGAAFVYHGSATGLSTTAAWTGESNKASASYGYSVSTAGDVNGDGYSDVIVGAYLYEGGQSMEGAAFVYHGSASGLSTSAAWTDEGNLPGAYYGHSVSTAGDVNGDGYSDVIVGASSYSNGQSVEGAAFVYHGSASGLATTATWTKESDKGDTRFGYSVSTAGDVNGDGYSDVIVGASSYDNDSTNEGGAFVFYGNGEVGGGLAVTPGQFRTNGTTPVVSLCKGDSASSIYLGALARSPFGGGKVKIECEVKPFSTAFDGTGTVLTDTWTTVAVGGTAIGELVTSLSGSTAYHWRVRLKYEPASLPYQQASRWLTSVANGVQEKDFFTDAAATPTAPTDPGTSSIATDSITWTWQDNSSDETGFKVYADPGSSAPATLKTTTTADATSWQHSSLTPNTQYAFQVCATNSAFDSSKTTTLARYTLAADPSAGNNVTCDRTLSSAYPSGTVFTFSNPAGFGAGTHGGTAYQVSSFNYAWNTSTTYTFTGSESEWTASTLEQSPSASGSYYLHLQSVNASDTASSTLDYGPFVYDADPPAAPSVGGTTPTTDRTPTWNWSGAGGGNGTFRYNLDTAGWIETTDTSCTPASALGFGSHTLAVQERDAAGNWSSSGTHAIVVQNTPPQVQGLYILPAAPLDTSDLRARYTYYDADGDAMTSKRYRWYKDGDLQAAYNNQNPLPAEATAPGEDWSVGVAVYDGTSWSAEATATVHINTAPEVQNLRIRPGSPVNASVLEVRYVYYDADSDARAGKRIFWYKDSVLQETYSYLSQVPAEATAPGEVWEVAVSEFDGQEWSAEERASVTINNPPEVQSLRIRPASPGDGSELEVRYTYFDANSDARAAKRVFWNKDEARQDAYSYLSRVPASATAPGEKWEVFVSLYDGKEWSAEASASVTIGAKSLEYATVSAEADKP